MLRIAKTQTGKWLFSSTTFPQHVGDQKNQEGPISLIRGELVFMAKITRKGSVLPEFKVNGKYSLS